MKVILSLILLMAATDTHAYDKSNLRLFEGPLKSTLRSSAKSKSVGDQVVVSHQLHRYLKIQQDAVQVGKKVGQWMSDAAASLKEKVVQVGKDAVPWMGHTAVGFFIAGIVVRVIDRYQRSSGQSFRGTGLDSYYVLVMTISDDSVGSVDGNREFCCKHRVTET